ncbi:hypothetical protein Dimus_017253 [Dionaea muscipula]
MACRRSMRAIPLFLIMILVISPTIFSSILGSSVQSLHRRDPLRTFKYYDGDYDLRNKHYWASAAFTGICGYAMAGAWLFFGIFLAVKTIAACGRSPVVVDQHPADSWYYYVVFSAVILFTLFAIIATGLVIAANQQFLRRTERVKATLLGAGSDTQVSIHKVNTTLSDMQLYLCPYDQQICSLLNKTTHGLGSESLHIQRFLKRNGHLIDQLVWTWYVVNLVVVSMNLAFLVVGFVLVLFHWQTGFIIIIFLCWILTIILWILTGVDFFLDTFAEDTCAALQEFKENPDNNSLSWLIPCANLQEADNVTVEIGRTIHNFITELNSMIAELRKQLALNEKGDDDDLWGAREICDPFSSSPNYSYSPGNCPKDSIPIGSVLDILGRFNGRLVVDVGGADHYAMACAYVQGILDLINIYPDLENLIQCSSFVKDKISKAADLILIQCRPFIDSMRWLCSCVLSLSIVMVGLLFIWVIKAYQAKARYC